MTETERWDVYLTGTPTQPGPGQTAQEALAEVLRCDLNAANTALTAIPVRVGANLDREVARRLFNAIGYIGGTSRAVAAGALPPTHPVQPTASNRALPSNSSLERTVIPRGAQTAPHRIVVSTGAEQVVAAQEAGLAPRASRSVSQVAIVGTVGAASGSHASIHSPRSALTSGSSYAVPKVAEPGGGWIIPTVLFLLAAAALVIVPMRLKRMDPIEIQETSSSVEEGPHVDVSFEFAATPRDVTSFSIWLSGPAVDDPGTASWGAVSIEEPSAGVRYDFRFAARDLIDPYADEHGATVNIAFDGQTYATAPVDLSLLF